MEDVKFEFARSRGIVWVCDVKDSSKLLNNDQSADDLENFLPRLYWTAKVMVEASGGVFVKWTGDGFLAWFETPLHREAKLKMLTVMTAIQHLNIMCRSTKLATGSTSTFELRHGLTFEQDALVTTLVHRNGHQQIDLMGRAIVLAFRLAGVNSKYPSIVAHGDVVRLYRSGGGYRLSFKKWQLTQNELLKNFKGERWGTSDVYHAAYTSEKAPTIDKVIKLASAAIKQHKEGSYSHPGEHEFIMRMMATFQSGPIWAQQVLKDYIDTAHALAEIAQELKKSLEDLRILQERVQPPHPQGPSIS